MLFRELPLLKRQSTSNSRSVKLYLSATERQMLMRSDLRASLLFKILAESSKTTDFGASDKSDIHAIISETVRRMVEIMRALVLKRGKNEQINPVSQQQKNRRPKKIQAKRKPD